MKSYVDQALKLRKWVSIGHHIPGRVRLKYKLGIVAHLAKFRAGDIEQAIASIPAFKHYQLNNVTGSILIEYDAATINPQSIEALFSESDQVAEQACYAIAEQLDLNGERS
ncbi:cation transporter [Vibrio sp. Vb2880]|uniref:HMA2 domain-containing protein n=1 Tax=Vibrio TaxID=662 RepID=UPI000A60E75E|nr:MULTISPECIES: cation transporter [Vibrio]MBO0215327.1 cation transporter [Vibrio sp. Vb2880]MCG6214170.1 cation transporter [Vibrio furnissii]MCG6216380.1 cation transporter [Vibrio furnissii]MCG6228371.1 cation transporter [Vibrio furnissii]MCG6232215.1 cation transporter [Vibrio furnissii]